MQTKKRNKFLPLQYYVVECPACDWASWMWKSIRGAYSEFSQHFMQEHDSYIEFVGEGDDE